MNPENKSSKDGEPTLDYFWELTNQAGDLPLSFARNVMETYREVQEISHVTGLQNRVSDRIICPKCSLPWIAGQSRSRLVAVGPKKKLKRMLSRERNQPRKLTKKDKLTLQAFHEGKNILVVKCLLCKHEMMKLCTRQANDTKVTEEELAAEVKKKKRRKKKKKEENAGLVIGGNKVNSDKEKIVGAQINECKSTGLNENSKMNSKAFLNNNDKLSTNNSHENSTVEFSKKYNRPDKFNKQQSSQKQLSSIASTNQKKKISKLTAAFVKEDSKARNKQSKNTSGSLATFLDSLQGK